MTVTKVGYYSYGLYLRLKEESCCLRCCWLKEENVLDLLLQLLLLLLQKQL